MQPHPEQSLEWTSQPYLSGMYFFKDFIAQLVIGIPLVICLLLIPEPISVGICLLTLALLITIILWGQRPSRKLCVTRQTITMIETTTFRTKERRMTAAGAKVRAVYLDFFERLFTVDLYRMNSAYHIEIARNGETFLFPCMDATQQRQIIKQIEEFGRLDVMTAYR